MIAMHTFRAMAPSWMLSYSWDGEEKINPSDAMKNLFVSQVMSGANAWDASRHVMSGSNDYDTRKQVYQWIKENEQMIYQKREPLSPVGVYFSPNTCHYFSDSWDQSYFGTMELLMEKGIAFEIVTPRTLNNCKSNLLIFTDVRSLAKQEVEQLENILKQGKKHIVFTARTGEYDSLRVPVKNNPIQSLIARYKSNVTYIDDDPGSGFGKFMDWAYDASVYKDKELEYKGSRSFEKLQSVIDAHYVKEVEIENANGCVSQLALVNGKQTVYIANFTGLKSKENAIPIPRREVSVTFRNLSEKGTVATFIPFLGKPVHLKGVWRGNDLTVILPTFLRGAIVTLDNY